jgi:hypothetical protein
MFAGQEDQRDRKARMQEDAGTGVIPDNDRKRRFMIF